MTVRMGLFVTTRTFEGSGVPQRSLVVRVRSKIGQITDLEAVWL